MTAVICTPGNHRAIGFDRYTMPKPGRHADHIVQSRRDCSLAESIVSPAEQSSVASQSQDVIIPGGKRHDISRARRHIDLSVVILTPRRHCPIALESVTGTCTGIHTGQ